MNTTQRKLTTIFSADVQDYTRLMGADEEGTLATLKRYRDAMSRLIGAHGGRVINTWGDGLIAEFPSVVEAVRTAVDVQNELAELNGARSAEGRMLFRIGINLGDVIVEGDDIYGDGVNVAARLQATAAAGGIVISNTVYDQVRNKIAVGFEFLGPLKVKNVEDAVPSYAVRIGEKHRVCTIPGTGGAASGSGKIHAPGNRRHARKTWCACRGCRRLGRGQSADLARRILGHLAGPRARLRLGDDLDEAPEPHRSEHRHPSRRRRGDRLHQPSVVEWDILGWMAPSRLRRRHRHSLGGEAQLIPHA
jgi:class 3 adenylate cyclase